MARECNVVIGALIGAVVGAGVASLLAIWLGGAIVTECELVVCSQIMGIVGLVSGAICGATIVRWPNGEVGAKFAAMLMCGGMIIVSIIPVGLYSVLRPCPAPRPCPGFAVTKSETLGASGWHYRSQVYTATLHIDYLQQYYAKQMNRYCKDTWYFERSSDSEYVDCREASCKIRFGVDPQFFNVRLCPVTETQIRVIQKDTWDLD